MTIAFRDCWKAKPNISCQPCFSLTGQPSHVAHPSRRGRHATAAGSGAAAGPGRLAVESQRQAESGYDQGREEETAALTPCVSGKRGARQKGGTESARYPEGHSPGFSEDQLSQGGQRPAHATASLTRAPVRLTHLMDSQATPARPPARYRRATSPRGHSTRRPSAVKKVPKAVRPPPTPILSCVSGSRRSGR